MSSINLAERIAPNFTLGSALNWMDKQPSMSEKDREMCRKMVHERYIKEEAALKPLIIQSALFLQANRNWLNGSVFREWMARNRISYSNDCEFGLLPLSWLRTKEWELIRNRSGASRHVIGDAVDFRAILIKGTCSNINAVNLCLFKELERTHNGGLAILRNGNAVSFIHVDHRATRARWNY